MNEYHLHCRQDSSHRWIESHLASETGTTHGEREKICDVGSLLPQCSHQCSHALSPFLSLSLLLSLSLSLPLSLSPSLSHLVLDGQVCCVVPSEAWPSCRSSVHTSLPPLTIVEAITKWICLHFLLLRPIHPPGTAVVDECTAGSTPPG